MCTDLRPRGEEQSSDKESQLGRLLTLALSRLPLGGWTQGLRRHLLRPLLHGLGPIPGAAPRPRSSLKVLPNPTQGTGSHFWGDSETGTDGGETVVPLPERLPARRRSGKLGPPGRQPGLRRGRASPTPVPRGRPPARQRRPTREPRHSLSPPAALGVRDLGPRRPPGQAGASGRTSGSHLGGSEVSSRSRVPQGPLGSWVQMGARGRASSGLCPPSQGATDPRRNRCLYLPCITQVDLRPKLVVSSFSPPLSLGHRICLLRSGPAVFPPVSTSFLQDHRPQRPCWARIYLLPQSSQTSSPFVASTQPVSFLLLQPPSFAWSI